MFNKRYSRKGSFTLVELLVAMTVFSILLLLMLQFFSGAQKMWTSTEKRNELYADARIAMDLMTSLIQSSVAIHDNIPFVIPSSKDELYLVTKNPINLGGDAGTLALVVFYLKNNNELYIKRLVNTDANFEFFFRPFGSTGAATDFATLANQFPNLKSAGVDEDKVLSNVISLTFNKIPSSSSDNRPLAIEIKLSLMDAFNFDLWKNGSTAVQQTLEERHLYTFSRIVYLDKIDSTVF